MFADKYLIKNNNEGLIDCRPAEELGITVVIPCYREPEIQLTLESVKQCDLPDCSVEVIVLINHSEISTDEVISYNRNTAGALEKWVAQNSMDKLKFYVVGPVVLKKKWAGAGLARKKGMDEAIRRFNLIEKEDGVIVSLDADTLVEKNYLLEIEKHFRLHPKNVGATLAFEHRKDNLADKQQKGIVLYEQYLDYYKRALDFTTYPHAMFTIGSAFAVRALAYVKRGGMNRRQAGEDFYFLQNLVQMGEVGEILSTKVHPSSRLSDRVPFGTGPVLQKWMNGEEDLTQTYNFRAFVDLKKLFLIIGDLYKIDEQVYGKIIESLPVSIARFLSEDGFWNELFELNQNCSSLAIFQSRFFQKFNAFKILKFLNFAHPGYYEKADLQKQRVLLDQEQ